MIKRPLILLILLIAVPCWAITDCGDAVDNTWCIETTDTTVDGDTACDSTTCTSADTLILDGGARGSILFRDFDGDGSYITIMNEDTNRVVITHDSAHARGIVSFDDCKYVDFRGDNNSSYIYGIKVVSDGSPNTPARNIWIYGESSYLKIGYIETEWTGTNYYGASGLGAAENPLDWIWSNIEIHHNYIHGSHYAGMYIGHNKADIDSGAAYVQGWSIHDNIIIDAGSYGITYKGINATVDSYIYNNYVQNTGQSLGEGCAGSIDTANRQGIGSQYSYNGTGVVHIYNNWVENTAGTCLKLNSTDFNVYGNVLFDCGYDATASNQRGINLTESELSGDWTAYIYNNTLIDIGDDAIFNDGFDDVYISNNIIYDVAGDCMDLDWADGTATYAFYNNDCYGESGYYARVEGSTYSTDTALNVRGDAAGNIEDDPQLNNIGSKEFWPATSSSNVVEAGYNVGDPYDTLLLSTSDFTASPPSVLTDQFANDYIGAYGLVGSATPTYPIQGAAGNFEYN